MSRKYIARVEFMEWCNSTNEPIYRTIIELEVDAKNVDDAIFKVYDEIEKMLEEDIRDSNDNWDCGDIEYGEFGVFADCYQKNDDDIDDNDCQFDECYHRHTLSYELHELLDDKGKTVWSL